MTIAKEVLDQLREENKIVSETIDGGISTERRRLLNEFVEEIRAVLVSGHQEYGETAETIYSVLGPPACGYAVSEKGLRYGRKGNKKDLVKAATYAFLGWTVAK